jgi:hypothetical protein
MTPVPAVGTPPLSANVALVGLVALAVVMPFEPLQPVITLRWQRVTLVELTLMAAVAAWAAALAGTHVAPPWRTPLTAPWLVLIAGLLASAWLAPSHRTDALKIVARLATGFVIGLMVVSGVRNRRHMFGLMCAVTATGTVVAGLGILEYLGVPVILGWLNHFRDGVRVVGGQVRAGATLQYPTITAMYLEIVFAFGVGLLLHAWDHTERRRVRWRIVLLITTLVIVAEALTLTWTRAGLVGMLASVIAIAAWRYERRGFDGGVRLTIALSALGLLLPLLSWSNDAVRLRLWFEGRHGWYRATFAAAPALKMVAGAETWDDVTATNTGRVTWHPTDGAPFRASYHWLDGDSDRVIQYDGARTELPADVSPGAGVQLTMRVGVPAQPGRYRLAWDIVQEHRLWFSTESGAALTWTDVTVVAGTAPARPWPTGRGPRVVPPTVVVLGRLQLWRAALAMWRDHPLFGVGPDNFRLTYGAYVGQAAADPRVHSNSMYTEWLAGGGAIGACLFGWMVVRTGRLMRTTRAWLPEPSGSLYMGVAAAGVALLVHGVLDSFLTFTPTYMATALLLGLAASPAAWPEGRDAYRV